MPKKRRPTKAKPPRVVIADVPGRQSKFLVEYAKTAAVMARCGMIDSDIADALGVDYRTFKRWVARYPSLKDALVMSKPVADDAVEYSLYRQAQDRYVMEEEAKVIDGQIVKVQVRKFVPANVTATLAWLNNRRRDSWSRNPEPEALPPPVKTPEELDITPENARQMARKVALVLFKGGKVA